MKTFVLNFLSIILLVCSTTIVLGQSYSINGDLGIDTLPQHKLDVNGDGRFKGELILDDKLRIPDLASSDSLIEKLVYIDENGRMQRLGGGGARSIEQYLHALPCKGGPLEEDVLFFWKTAPGKITAYDEACGTPKVGIGTEFPEARLHVRGTSYFSGGTGIGVLNTGDARIMVRTTQSNNALLIQGSTVESGEVVHKDIFKVHGNGEVQIDRAAGGAWEYGIKLTAGHSDLKAFSLRLTDDSTDRLTIFGDGRLKINTDENNIKAISIYNTVAEKDAFQIWSNGNIWATAVHVREFGHNDFPDYVFEPDYKLMSFADLRTFIKDNQRLPNMPSADDVKRNGADLGEMNRLLVEKVEELTLYILELEKRLNKIELE